MRVKLIRIGYIVFTLSMMLAAGLLILGKITRAEQVFIIGFYMLLPYLLLYLFSAIKK